MQTTGTWAWRLSATRLNEPSLSSSIDIHYKKDLQRCQLLTLPPPISCSCSPITSMRSGWSTICTTIMHFSETLTSCDRKLCHSELTTLICKHFGDHHWLQSLAGYVRGAHKTHNSHARAEYKIFEQPLWQLVKNDRNEMLVTKKSTMTHMLRKSVIIQGSHVYNPAHLGRAMVWDTGVWSIIGLGQIADLSQANPKSRWNINSWLLQRHDLEECQGTTSLNTLYNVRSVLQIKSQEIAIW